MKSKSPKAMWFGFDVTSDVGAFARPKRIEFWKDKDFDSLSPESPFHYKSDALLGLALFQLHPKWTSAHLPSSPTPMTADLWRSLEPHHELFLRAQTRVHALRSQMKIAPKPEAEQFCRTFSEVLINSSESWGLNLESLTQLTEVVDQLEIKGGRPLLYDFSLQFDTNTRQKLHWLHSLLFHLRTMVAMDYNAYIQDATHEAIKVDSITDYLARGEYVANDALLYLTFKRMRDKMPTASAEQMEQAFLTYSHNGAYLIESLPKSFLSALKTDELEETLYLVQMDWLLGTDAGLLFRIREELYGITEGYEKIFWTDKVGHASRSADRLSVQCELTEDAFNKVA